MSNHRVVAAVAILTTGCASFPADARFLQVDPVGYQDQVNLYAYVDNDPLNGTDPTGNRILIRGTPEYRREVAREIRQIQARKDGNSLVNSLIRNPKIIWIQSHSDASTPTSVRNMGNLTEAQNEADASNRKGTGSTIYFDPTNKGGVDINGSNIRPSFVGLAHELGHGEDNINGTRADSAPNDLGPGTTPKIEENAVDRENQVRKENGVAPRTAYDPPATCSRGPGKCQ